MTRLIVFPRKSNKPKKGDSSAEELKAETVTKIGTLIPKVAGFSEVKKSDAPKNVEGGAYRQLRNARADFRNQGAREKRAKDKADAEAAKK